MSNKRRMTNPVSAIMTAIRDIRDTDGLIAPSPSTERLDGKTCFVTGANSGLGKAIATELARRGATLIMGLRRQLDETVSEIVESTGNTAVSARRVDLSDIRSVDALISGLANDEIVFDRVILNAGLMAPQARQSAQGLELMLAVHWLANQRIITEFMERGIVNRSTGARVIVVSSESHRSAPPFDAQTFDVFQEHNSVSAMKQYGHSKLILNLAVRGLAERYADTGVGFFHLCPGPVNSGIAREAPAALRAIVGLAMSRFFPSPEKASAPAIYLAASPDLEGRTNEYMHLMRFKPPSDTSMDRDDMQAVLARGEEIFTAL